MILDKKLNLDKSFYDQSTFYGRFQHFLHITDWRLLFHSNKQLDEAKDLLKKYKNNEEVPGITEDQLWKAKYLHESAFHPDSGEKQNLVGRMSCQVPGGMLITGAMLSFYQTRSAVIFWQWLNQSFNALVNYTNRNAKSSITPTQMGVAYASATSAALIAALGLKKALVGTASTLLQRFVPFAAVAAANCANIPLMRQSEITSGVAVFDQNGNNVTSSKLAACKGISQVVLSRVLMAAPGMTLLPLAMEALERRQLLRRGGAPGVILQTAAVGLMLSVMTPASCAIFPQQCRVSVSSLQRWEPTAYAKLQTKYEMHEVPKYLFFNKGL